MIDEFVQKLKSIDSAQRREAIIGLGKAGDPGALQHLAYVYKTDPDPALRDLALKAARYLQKTWESGKAPVPQQQTPPADQGIQWPEWSKKITGETPSADTPAWIASAAKVEELPSRVPIAEQEGFKPSWAQTDDEIFVDDEEVEQYVSPQRQKIAQGQLRQAFTFRANNDVENAINELAKAIKTDPAVARLASVRRLAIDLMGGIPPKQALAGIMERYEAGQLKRTHSGEAILNAAFGKRMIILAIEIPILYLVLLGFVLVYSYRIKYGAVSDVDFILPNLIRSLDGNLLARALPVALISLGSVMFYIVVTYFIGLFGEGTGTVMRFLNIMLALQIVTFLVVGTGMLIVPHARYYPTGTPGQYYVQFNLGWLFVGGVWVLGMQAYFTGRAHNVDVFKGGAIAVIGAIAAGVLSSALGLFSGSLFG